MSIFKIETSEVESIASELNNIASKISDLNNQIDNYDVNCIDNFDFNSVKNAISSNMEACMTKVTNTSKALNIVSKEHSTLQNILKYNNSNTNNTL